MFYDEQPSVIHFHQLTQPQLNLLLQVCKKLSAECCVLGYQEVKESDFLIMSSSTRIAEVEEIRMKHSNLIFLVIDKKLGAFEVNEYIKMGNICFIDEVNDDELFLRVETSKNKKPISKTDDQEDALAIISHDLKNPLNAIRLDAQILLRNSKRDQYGAQNKEIKKIAGRIINTTDRLSFMISDLLDGNQKANVLTSLTRSKVDMEILIGEVIEVMMPLAAKKNLAIKTYIEQGFPKVIIDKNKIFQVILNLLTNALKFSQNHSIIQINLTFKDNTCSFTIDDGGPGVESSISEKIFERYYSGQLNACGSGLGLYICKTIIEAHHGQIGLINLKEGGARFFFTLPTLMEKNIAASPKIYLIDDDEDLRDVLSWALNGEGYDVESFASPLRALEYMESKADHPALILTDFQMSGMKVEEFLAKKSLLDLQNIPVLILTSSPNKVGEEISENHYSEVLTKPLNLDALIETVSKYMHATSIQSK